MLHEEVETTAEGFRKLNQDVIFIAGSQDIKPLRSEVEWAIKNTLHRLKPGSELKPYSWDIETSDTGFDQTKSMQKQLPRPSNDKCKGVICLMAERIGHPLEDDFNLHLIPDIEDWTNPGHKYRLKHPWPDDLKKQKRLIEDGYYPLTGTVFEIIDAYSARGETKTPIRFCVIANKAIELNNNQSVGLGNYRLRSEKAKSIEEPEFSRWMQNDYNLQTAAVKNFVCALIKKGIDQNNKIDYEAVIKDIKGFVEREIIKKSAETTNPYNFLKYFDVLDADNFHGREREIERAAQDLLSRFNSARYQNVVRIVGRSGAGKSSFLRAGLLAHFQKPKYRGDVRTVVFGPTDFQKKEDGTVSDPMLSILQFVEEQTDLVIPPPRRRDVSEQGPGAAKLSIELLQRILPKATNGQRSKLVFGVDQFEEIVDYLLDKQKARHWDPIIRFIEEAGKSESIGVAYTLENSRKDSLVQINDLPPVFRERDEIKIDGFHPEFIRSIIEDPFKKAGYPLCPDVVEKIYENAEGLTSEEGPRTEDSILPLIALKLSKLFDYIRNISEPITNMDLTETMGAAFDENAAQDPFCIQLEDVEDQLNFDSLIEEEAKKAWREATQETIVDPERIDYFLQPLVGIASLYLNHPQLQTMQWPFYSDEQKLAESFERHRLLVRAAKGFRLVHEAVIRYWPDALKWFENQRDFLKKKASFRNKASEWAGRGCPLDIKTITEDDVDTAAEILGASLRVWSLGQGTCDSISDDDKLLRDYCLFVFGHSRTPAKKILYMGKETSPHVYCAAMYGRDDLLEVFRQIDQSCLELANKKGRTPLYAAAWAQADTVKYLLENGVKPVRKDDEGWPPIAAPIRMGRMDIFTTLLKATDGEGLDGPNGISMLHLCAQFGRDRMASYLVDHHSLKPDQPAKRRWMPLHYAAADGQLEAFIYFAGRSEITEVVDGEYTALHLAASNGQKTIVEHLLKEPGFRRHFNAETDDGKTALHLASENRHPEIVRLLLQASDPNQPIAKKEKIHSQNLHPLHLALTENLNDPSYDPDSILKTVRALLDDPRTDPNATDNRGNTPLALASNLRKVQELLLRDPRLDPTQPISEDGETPLTHSAKLGDWKTFRVLEERSPKISSGPVDKAKNTILHLFIENQAPQDLIEGILSTVTIDDLNALNEAGLTPLLVGIKNKKWSQVRKLLNSNEVDPTYHGPKTPSALMLALEMRADKDTLSMLVKRSPALLTEPDYLGWTPMHQAIAYRQLDWIEWLRAQAKDSSTLWDQRDRLGRRPVDLASPLIREELPLSEEASDWPSPKSWDSNLKWTLVEGVNRVGLIERIDRMDEGYTIADEAEIQTAALSFYDPEAVQIVRIKSPAWNHSALKIYYLIYDDSLYRLNGTSPPIHEVNDKSNIALNADNLLSYLRFFCFFVRGEEGPFLIAESPDQTEIPSTLTEAERAELLRVLRPAYLKGYDEEKVLFLAMASVYYSNAIFIADFSIQKTGMISMINDQPTLGNLSAKVNQPLD